MNREEFLRTFGMALGGAILSPSLLKSAMQNTKERNLEGVCLNAVGDITLAEFFDDALANMAERSSDPYEYMIKDVKSEFGKDDINIGNLECTFTKSGRHKDKPFTFKTKYEHIDLIRRLNMDIMNLANNHFMDYYNSGAKDTIKLLRQSGIEYCGGGLNASDASSPRFITKNDVRVGFLGYAMVGKESYATTHPGTNMWSDESKPQIKSQISKAKDSCDALVVSIHWGEELHHSASKMQRDAAKIIRDSGADIILGHHPHVLEEIHEYKNNLTFYSLGNFIFGGNKNPHDKNSMIAKVSLGKNGILDYKKVHVITHRDGILHPTVC